MKLQDLFERESFSNFDEIFHYLMNNCRPALKQMATPLYRGMGGTDKYDKIISSCKRWENDDHMHMGSQYAEFYDKWMTESFGHPYLSQGLFTTGSKQHSSEYGEVFIVLPIGSFEYVWSPNVGDQIDLSHQFDRMKDYNYDQFKKYMDTLKYTDTGIGQAVKTDHEIILKCGRYFHISEATLKEWKSEYDTLEELWSDLRG